MHWKGKKMIRVAMLPGIINQEMNPGCVVDALRIFEIEHYKHALNYETSLLHYHWRANVPEFIFSEGCIT